MTDLSGQVAWVTGASRGIGSATATALAAAGARVILSARSAAPIRELAATIGNGALAIPCDVADWASVSAAVRQAEATVGHIDLLVANAGVIEPIERFADSTPADWGRLIDVNVKGVYHCARAVVPGMISRRRGRIVTIGSGAAHGPLEGWSHYCTSKAAALMISRAIDAECAGQGIVSINLSPGTVATEMQRAIGRSGVNPVSQMPFADHKPAAAVGAAVVHLAGPQGDAFAGKEVHIKDLPIRWG